MAGEVRTIDIGRRRIDLPAVDQRRQGAAIAGEGAAQIRDNSVALPVRHREKLRRDHPLRQAVRLEDAAGIGVVAAGDLQRRLDQEAAGIVADRAERIVVQLHAPAHRLARHIVGHPGRQRLLVGALRRRHRETKLACEIFRRLLRRLRAGTCGLLRLDLRRIIFRQLSLAIERVVAGLFRTAGRGQAVARHFADARLRRRLARARIGIVGIGRARRRRWRRRRVDRSLAGLAQRQILRRDEAADLGIEQAGAEILRDRGFRDEEQPRAAESRAQEESALSPAPGWTRPHDQETPTKSLLSPARSAARQNWRAAEKVVNGVKTIMVNEPLRSGRSHRLPSPPVLSLGALPGTHRWQANTR